MKRVQLVNLLESIEPSCLVLQIQERGWDFGTKKLIEVGYLPSVKSYMFYSQEGSCFRRLHSH